MIVQNNVCVKQIIAYNVNKMMVQNVLLAHLTIYQIQMINANVGQKVANNVNKITEINAKNVTPVLH